MGVHTFDANDNADSFDCTPNSTLDEGVSSPYRAIWYNSDLDAWLNTAFSDDSEQPAATSDGNKFGPKAEVGRGLKLPEASRRLYQKVEGLTPGTNYTFFIDTRSEVDNLDPEVFMLNTEIVTEVGLENGAADPRVDAYLKIENDFNSTKSSDTEDTFTTNTIEFTASGSFVVIYVRSLNSIDSSNEVFIDNIELYETAQLSTEDKLASKFRIYPNPAKDILTIESNNIQVESVRIFSLLGKEVFRQNGLISREVNISNLSSGMYILKIATNSGSLSQKIVVK
ncbi:T9SS type A sorting domain-containing protein [Hyunsoonleella jejuensis]|nr:T9SS type A sorting domain-containing protein [Hyunsoonleella jejuensis]